MVEGLRLESREQNSSDKIPDTYLSLQVQVGPVSLVVPGEVGIVGGRGCCCLVSVGAGYG